ncbi:MAG: hypothetical protein AAGA54_18460 [Myxococcota bacterium]
MMMKKSLLFVAFALFGAGACDLPDKDIGDESETAAADSGTPGDACEPGETVPAADGCNTCTCDDDGALACTEIACEPDCEPGTTVPAGDGCNTCLCNEDGSLSCTEIGCDPGSCEDGDEMPAGDGCNTCTCDGGDWICTTIGCAPGDCEPGTTVDAPDGCNTCECLDDGTLACTEIACEPGGDDPFDDGGLAVCGADVPFDPVWIESATLEGDLLTVGLSYSGGCEEHLLGGCWDLSFNESEPVQTSITIAHDSMGDLCEAAPFEEVVIDLTLLREQYAEAYGSETGTIMLGIAGYEGSIEYTF